MTERPAAHLIRSEEHGVTELLEDGAVSEDRLEDLREDDAWTVEPLYRASEDGGRPEPDGGEERAECPTCRGAGSLPVDEDTPDPSEGEVRCDHENTVLDDNVEWCPDCRRVMPEDPEDAEDDGRGEVSHGDVAEMSYREANRALSRRLQEITDGGDPAWMYLGHIIGLLKSPAHSDAEDDGRGEWKRRQCGACGAGAGDECFRNCPAKGCDCPTHSDADPIGEVDDG